MNLCGLLAKACSARWRDELAGLAAVTADERVFGRLKVAAVTLARLFRNPDDSAIVHEREQGEV